MEHPIKLTDADQAETHAKISEVRDTKFLVQGPLLDEKTEQFIELFDITQKSVLDELERLGVEPSVSPLPQDKVYICEDETMSKNFNALAFYDSEHDVVFVTKSLLQEPAKLEFILAHEITHRYSQNYWSKVESGEIVRSRVGYQIESPWKNSIGPARMFNGFNEICTDMIAATALKNKGVKLEDEFFTYLTEESGSRALLGGLAKTLSGENNWTFSEAWDFIERGAISDAWPVFRKIDESYGAGSARILGYMQATKVPEHLQDWQIELNKLILIYFLIADTSKRDEISDMIRSHLKTKPAAPEQETPTE
jgi:hypothetical protein